MRLFLRQRLHRPALTLATPIILIGLVGTAVAVTNRSGDPVFVSQQRNLADLQPAALAHLVTLAPDPQPGLGRPRAISARCSPHGYGALRNPWVCFVRYARGGTIRYGVEVSIYGRIEGVDPTGRFLIHGCCVGPRSGP